MKSSDKRSRQLQKKRDNSHANTHEQSTKTAEIAKNYVPRNGLSGSSSQKKDATNRRQLCSLVKEEEGEFADPLNSLHIRISEDGAAVLRFFTQDENVL
jgi:hypothetical protein